MVAQSVAPFQPSGRGGLTPSLFLLCPVLGWFFLASTFARLCSRVFPSLRFPLVMSLTGPNTPPLPPHIPLWSPPCSCNAAFTSEQKDLVGHSLRRISDALMRRQSLSRRPLIIYNARVPVCKVRWAGKGVAEWGLQR